MKPTDPFSFEPQKSVNRVAIPLKLLEASDTTLLYAQIQKSLKNNELNLKFFKYANLTLYILIGAFALYFLLQVSFLERRALNKGLEKSTLSISETVSTLSRPETELKDLQRLMETRDIFQPTFSSEESRRGAIEDAKEEIYKKIRVVGIMIDNDPKAIIEFIANGESTFVSLGQEVAGAVVKEILENKIVLSYKGMELELFR